MSKQSKKENDITKSFEENYSIINNLLESNRHRWTLAGLAWISFEDVKQIILVHLFEKWSMWDKSRPIQPWCNRIIINQIKNIRRNVYDNMSRPCLRCPENQGGDLCAIYKTQNSSCSIYRKWEKTKKHAFEVKLPVSSENHQQEISELPFEHSDLSEMEKTLHSKMEEILKPMEYKIYKFLYIDGLKEEEAVKKLNFTGDKNKKAGLNNLLKIKKMIIVKVKKVLGEGIA